MKKTNLEKLDLTLYYDKICGLDVYVVPKKSNSCYAVYTTKYGSIDSTFMLDGEMKVTPLGVAHFLEHKMFESETSEDPFTFYAKNGADANASTSYYKTSYLFSGCNCFEENLNFLIDYVNNPYFTDENILKEQGIIGQEIEMVRDDPYRRMYEEIMSNVFVNHPIKNSVIGSKESIASIKCDDLYDIYNSFYIPSNMFLVVTGNVDPLKVFDIVQNNLGKREFKKVDVSKLEYEEPDNVNRASSSIIMDVSVPKCSLTYKINIKDLKLHNIDIMMYASIYLNSKFGQASILSERLKNIGLISETLGFDTDIVGDHLVMTIFGESKNYDELLKNINREMEDKKVNYDDFLRYKKVLISNLVYSSENIYSINDSITNSIVRYGTYEDRYKILSNLNMKDYENFIEYLNFENNSSFVIKNNNWL